MLRIDEREEIKKHNDDRPSALLTVNCLQSGTTTRSGFLQCGDCLSGMVCLTVLRDGQGANIFLTIEDQRALLGILAANLAANLRGPFDSESEALRAFGTDRRSGNE